MYPFVIKIALDAKRAALDDIIKPTVGLLNDRVELVIVDPPLFKAAVIFKNNSFFSNVHTSFYSNHHYF